MPLPSCRSPRAPERRAARVVSSRAALLVVAGMWACGGDGEIAIRGDVGGLDTLGYRADSLFAEADRLERTLDSLRAVAEGRLPTANLALPPRAATDAGGRAAVAARDGRERDGESARAAAAEAMVSGAGSMTARAQARGDSLARAAAQRLLAGTADAPQRGDSVRGTVVLVGSPPAVQPALRTADGATTTLSGMAAMDMATLGDVEVVVRGVRVSPRDIVVSDFAVRGARGLHAVDGRLESDGGRWVLLRSDGGGRLSLVGAPDGLRALAGRRVWVAFRPGTATPAAYGAIGR